MDKDLIPAGVLGAMTFAVLALIATLSQMTAVYMIENTATLQTPPEIGVYWDITGLEEVHEIGWGVLEPGETKTVTVYTKNAGNVDFVGSMATVDWIPIHTEAYITLDWDFGGSPLKVGRIRTTLLTLRISEDITGITDFSFTIIVTVTEV